MGIARRPFEMKIDLIDGKDFFMEGVEEYVSGFKYLYIRCVDKTLSFRREDIKSVTRRPSGTSYWAKVTLRRQNKKKQFFSSEEIRF